MMKRIIAIPMVALALTGCVGQQMDEGLKRLLGQNVKAAVAKIGYPDSQRTMLGDTIYVWGVSRDTIAPIPTSSTTTGMVGGSLITGTTTGTSFVPVNLNCKIQLATGANGVIKQYQWSGNAGGCSSYARALTR
jgi:hypothetical protein